MRKIYATLAVAFCFATTGFAQLTGIKTVPGDYASIALAVTDLNTQGVGVGGVTINVAAGFVEPAIAAPISLTATGTAANPIIIRKNGTGANPVINAYTTGTATAGTTVSPLDGIFRLVGSDYVTINGIDLAENAANTTAATYMEYGYALLKASVTDGCQFVTIRNCTISLNRNNVTAGTAESSDGSVGIWVANTLATGNATLTITAASGTNSNNLFYSNTLQNCNVGIYLRGFNASSPYTLYDQANDIGGTSSGTGNSILNFGGGTGAAVTSYGIRAIYQAGFNFSYNTVNNNNGSGVNHVSTLSGIFMSTATSQSGSINNNIVTLQGGGTTSTVSGVNNAGGSTSAGNTINLNNNNVAIGYSTATTGVVNSIINSGSASTVNINGNTITGIAANPLAGTGTLVMIETGSPVIANSNNNTVTNLSRNGASGSWRIIKTTTPTTWNCGNNTVDGVTWSLATSTGSTDAIYSLSSAVNENITNNIVRNISVPTTGTVNGVRVGSSSGTKTITGNQIYNFSTTTGGAGGATMYGIFGSVGDMSISGNQIYSLNSTGTTGGTSGLLAGINIGGGNSAAVFNNLIYDISTLSTNPGLYGIYATSGVNTIYNNLIGDLRTPVANAGIPLAGIYISGGTSSLLYYNTVNLNATSTGALFGSAAFYGTTSTNITLRNNIFNNLSTPVGATGFSASYRRTGTSLTSYLAASNNNLFYAGTPGVNNLIFYDGTNSDQTISAYRTRVASRDASSVTENPPFLSTVGSNPNFLHLNTTIATQVESGGVSILGFTTDYDGQTRNVTIPDIGADEFSGILLDLSGPSISYPNLTNGVVQPSRNVTGFTITDATGVNTTAGTRPRLYFKKKADAANTFNDNTSSTPGWKFVEANGTTTPFDFTINYALLQGGSVALADIIQYFVVAQDLVSIPNLSINAGIFTAQPASVNLSSSAFPITGTINEFNIVNAISGIRTVCASGCDYTSLTNTGGAFDAVNTSAVTANTILQIAGDLTTEAGTVALNEFASPFTISIYPTGAARTVSGSLSSNALIRLNGADRVTFDGSIGGTGTDRSLTITNTNTSSPTAISLISLGTGLGATNNTIRNCNISTVLTTSTGYGIAIGGATPGGSGADNDFVTIQNNNVTVATNSIYAFGTAAISAGGIDNLNITGNTLSNTTTIANFGIRVGNGLNGLITQNTISIETSAASQPVAISIETGFVSSTISRNNITKVLTTNTGGYGGRGITVGTGLAASALIITNNMISGVNGSNFSAFGNSSSMGIGIGMVGNSTTITTIAGGVGIFYNSINLYGDHSYTSATNTAGLYIGSGASALDVRNNIFVNSLNNTTTSGSKNYGIYSAAAATAFTNLNFNDYFFVNSTNSTGFVGFIASTDQSTLAAWRTATGLEANSVLGNPQFISASNLHISPTLTTPVESAASPISGITNDLDGDTRNATTPDIGADEGTFLAPLANDIAAVAFVIPVNTAGFPTGATVTPQASFINNGTSTQTNVTVRYRILNPSAVEVYNQTGVITSIAAGVTTTVTFPVSSVLTTPGTYTIIASSELVGDAIPANNTITGTITLSAPLAGDYMVGASQPVPFNTLTAAINALNGVGVSAAVRFLLTDATYSTSETFPIVINAFSGASASNSFTLRPATGVSPTITGSNTSAILRLNGADFVTINGSNTGGTSRDMTIENTNTGGTSVLWLSSTLTDGATNNTITNTNFRGVSGITTVADIIVSGNTIGGAAEVSNSNLNITNNSMIRSQNAVFAIGNATTPDQNWNFSRNAVGSTVVADKLGFRGIAVQNAANFIVNNNVITGVVTSTTSTSTGILVGALINGGMVSSNTISDVKNTNTTGYGAVGITLNSTSATSAVSVINNFISDVAGYGYITTATISDNGNGIFVNGGAGYSIYHNTISMNTNQTVTSLPAAINIGVGVTAAGAIDLRNNIFSNTQTQAGAKYTIYSSAPNTVFSNINYNDYVSSGTALAFIGSARTALADIQTGFGGNTNSVSIAPVFNSATDLHLSFVTNGTLDNLGTPIATVLTDADGDARSTLNPDLGADEFGPPLPIRFEYIKGTKTNSGNLIEWKITCNSTRITMDVERSADSRSFASINNFGADQARCANPFFYTDVQPLGGINYYRIKFTDVDGKISYSPTVAINGTSKGFEVVGLYPTIVRESAYLSINAVKAGTVQTLITDVTGKRLQTNTRAINIGSNILAVDVSLLASGAYNISVYNEGALSKTIRFVVSH